MSITKGDVEEAKENIRKILRKVDVFVYPPRFYLWCSIVAADVYFSREIGSSVTELCRLEALAKALEYSIANKRDKASLANLVMQRLLGYAKVNGMANILGLLNSAYGDSLAPLRDSLKRRCLPTSRICWGARSRHQSEETK